MSERPLRKRVLTAVVLAVALLVVLLVLPPVATVVVITAIVLLGAWEWSAFLQLPQRRLACRLRAASSALLLLRCLVVFGDRGGPRHRDADRASRGGSSRLLWIVFAPRRVTAWSAGHRRHAGAGTRLARADRACGWCCRDGAQWVLFALVLVWVADIGAYFCGRRFGRVRLAPQVSPGKTWEGVFGGMLLSALVAIAGALWFHLPLGTFLAAVPGGGGLLDRR